MSVPPGEVTLYIPAHNAARTLPAALASAERLAPPPAEVIVVADDRSSDDTLRIAAESGARVLRQSAGRLGTARNMAIEACRTPWLASCDADVVLEPGWLGALCAAADESVAAVGGGTHELQHTPADRWRAVNMPHNWGPLAFDDPFMLVSEMMARVAALRGVGGYLPELRYGEDSDLCQRLRQAGLRLRYEPAARAWHDRGDSVASVLRLRWDYAHHRQRQRFESLPGLTGKLDVNRSYALQSLSRTLHSEACDTAAIGLLIWPHHAERDLRAALERWPLLSAVDCDAALAAVRAALADGIPAAWTGWWCAARAALGWEATEAAAEPDGLSGLAGMRRHCAAVRDATARLFAELPAELAAPLSASLAVVTGGAAQAIERPRLAGAGGLDARPARPAWAWSELAVILDGIGGFAARGLRVLGPSLPEEAPGSPAGVLAEGGLVLVPHLECVAAPDALLAEALATAEWLVLGYRTPERIPLAQPIWTARDLSIAVARGGGRIADFHTEAGFTRLVVHRPRPRGPQPGGLVRTAALAATAVGGAGAAWGGELA